MNNSKLKLHPYNPEEELKLRAAIAFRSLGHSERLKPTEVIDLPDPDIKIRTAHNEYMKREAIKAREKSRKQRRASK